MVYLIILLHQLIFLPFTAVYSLFVQPTIVAFQLHFYFS